MIISGEGSKTMSESEEQICLFGGHNGLAANIQSLNCCSTSRMREKKRLYRSTYAFGRAKSRCPGPLLTRGKKRYHGLFVEMKAGKTSRPQIKLNGFRPSKNKDI